MEGLVRLPPAGGAGCAGPRRRRPRPRRPSWCRGRSWSRSSAARMRRTRRGLGAPCAGRGGCRADLPRSRAGLRAGSLGGVRGSAGGPGHRGVFGGHHGVVLEHRPDRAPHGQPQGRPPRREMCAWPEKAPEALSAGDSPACLTSEEELSYRRGSPVSAKIAGACQIFCVS